MSDINTPSNVSSQRAGEGAARVTRTSSTSDDSSAQQQPHDKKTPAPEKNPDIKEKPASYDTAVTISTSLSNLEEGSKISATYLGIDGQDRPLIASETGTYVVKHDPSHQKDIDKIPPNAVLSVKILKLDREIEARLIYQNPPQNTAPPLPENIPQPIPVTLELIGLGSDPPKIRASIDQNSLPPDPHKIAYRTTDIHRAEHIAKESANKLKELPLPSTTNYTLYERATPQQRSPAIIPSSIAGNGIIAQEHIAQTPPQILGQNKEQNKGQSLTAAVIPRLNIEKLLHVNRLAIVVKNIPQKNINLPEIVQKQLGQPGPLGNMKAGHNFTIRIDSITVPDILPQNKVESKIEGKPEVTAGLKDGAKSNVQLQHQGPADRSPPMAVPAPAQNLSGIVIDPAKNIPQQNINNMNAPAPGLTNKNSPYTGQYSQTAQTTPDPASKSIYIATPVSVIKIQSPIDLKPGTVINFNLPAQQGGQTDIMPAAKSASKSALKSERQFEQQANASRNPTEISSGAPANNAQEVASTGLSTPAQPTAPSATPISAAQIPPQPLENFIQNWQSLSQIISAMPPPEGIVTPALGNRIPSLQNPAQMTSGMIFFLAALGAKNPARTWLGPAVTQRMEKLEQGKLLNMLDNDMKRIFRLGAETAPNEWRPALMPMQVGTDVHAIPILTRQPVDEEADKKNNAPEDGDEDGDEDTTTRFIVGLNLSQIGEIQMDGLLNETKLNMIIQSKAILPAEMKKTISAMFISALEISGLAGDLQFKDNISPDISVQSTLNQRIHMLEV